MIENTNCEKNRFVCDKNVKTKAMNIFNETFGYIYIYVFRQNELKQSKHASLHITVR